MEPNPPRADRILVRLFGSLFQLPRSVVVYFPPNGVHYGTRDKDCSDCEQVVGEVVMVSFITTENHEFRASLVEDKLQQVGTNSRKPVSMHDHNFRRGRVPKGFAAPVA
jgi:hypothetical protein